MRAKRTLAQEHVPFEVPAADDRPARLSSVLEVIYLVFNEGYSATAGDDWMRPDLCAEALRLARVLAQLMPAEPEVHGLAALLEIQASRLAARTAPGRVAGAAAGSGPGALGPAADQPRPGRAAGSRGPGGEPGAEHGRLSTGRTCCRRHRRLPRAAPSGRRTPTGSG